MLTVDETKCDGCKLCEKNCPFGAIVVVQRTDDVKMAEVLDTCTLCGACLNVCAQEGLILERKLASPEELAKFSGVYVWAECEEQGEGLAPKKVVMELLHKGRELADKLGEELIVVVLADERPLDIAPFFAHGADGVIRYRHKLLKAYATDSFTTVISAIVSKNKPSVFLLGATPDGRDLAPRIAARLRLGLTADCTGLDIDEDRQLVQTRPAFGGNIMASIITPYTRPQMATVRPNTFPVGEVQDGRSGALDDFELTLAKGVIRTRVLEVEKPEAAANVNIADASVIVAAGKGCQRVENMALVRELADELGGVVAGSRAIVELGWIPHTIQVGQSGTTVSPDLYVACGISGAVQHLVGMTSAKTIIAINSDPEAPIFEVADVGIIGDAQEVLPALIKEIREAKKAA